MPKDLLKITQIKDGICAAECNCDSEIELERICAAIISFMGHNESFAKMLLKYVANYVYRRKEFDEVNRKATIIFEKKKHTN